MKKIIFTVAVPEELEDDIDQHIACITRIVSTADLYNMPVLDVTLGHTLNHQGEDK